MLAASTSIGTLPPLTTASSKALKSYLGPSSCLAFPEPDDLVLSDLVAAGLTRPNAVTIDLVRDLVRIGTVDVDKIVDRLTTRPALHVQPGVDD